MSEPTPEGARNAARRRALFRSFTLADLITLANASCGTLAIFLCLRYLAEGRPGPLWAAFVLFPAALVFDVLDGAVARWRHRQSPFGADLDSLADVVSFGVAPATLGYTLGLQGGFDVLVLVYFVVCGISRLARFNVTASGLAGASGKVTHYEGTPIPSSVLLVLLLGVAFWRGDVGPNLWFGAVQLGPWLLHPLVLVFFLNGTMMVSSVRIPKP